MGHETLILSELIQVTFGTLLSSATQCMSLQVVCECLSYQTVSSLEAETVFY